MIEFRRRRYFPERHYRLRLRWVLWAAMGLLLFAVFLFVRAIGR